MKTDTMSLLNIFKRKLPKGKIVWCIGIPYSEEQFSSCCKSDSDFIESLEFKYGTNDREILWKRYQPIANKIRKCVDFLRKKGVTIVSAYSIRDIKNVFTHSVVIIMAHRHRYLDSFDFMGNATSFNDVVDIIPNNYCGIIDVSSCHSALFQMQWKKKKINAKYIAAGTELSIDLRLFIYEHVIRYMISHSEKSYLQSLEVILNRIQSRANENTNKREDVFLGGDIPTKKNRKISASVFAPKEISREDDMMIQVYIYEDEEHDNVVILASNADEESTERDFTSLHLNLKIGDNVKIQLNILHYPEISQFKSFIWQGGIAKRYFNIKLPENFNKKKCFVEIVISVNDVPLGELSFIVKVVEPYLLEKVITDVYFKQYKKIFISYAHKDFDKVKFMAKAYNAQGVDYFFDRDYLKAGDIYPKKIKDYIDTSDLFILCWSQNAAESEYVKKEKSQALSLSKNIDDKNGTLTIHPISIEPRADLPSDMKDDYNFEVI